MLIFWGYIDVFRGKIDMHLFESSGKDASMLSINRASDAVRSYERALAKIFLLSAIFAAIATSTSYGATNLRMDERTGISGNVTYNSTPLTALVIANGIHLFTSGTQPGLQKGEFEFLNVPFDTNGRITLYAFASGFTPYKTVLDEGVSALEIEMVKNVGRKDINVLIETMTDSATKPGWVDIGGTIESLTGTPLCALALSNGQRMFTCNESLGRFDLTVPLDGNGRITLYAFASGFNPYKRIIDLSDSFLGLSTNVGVIGNDLDIEIYGRDFQSSYKIVMIPVVKEGSGARLEGVAGNVTVQNAKELILEQNTLYVAQGDLGVSIIDVSDPQQPKRVDDQSISDSVTVMAVSDDIMYTGYENRIQIYSVKDPKHPIFLSSFDLPDENIRLLEVMGNVLFACADTCESGCWSKDDCYYHCDNYLRVINVSSPNALSFYSVVSVPEHHSSNLIVSGRTGYLSGYSIYYMPGYLGMTSSSANYIVNLNDLFFPRIEESMINGHMIEKKPSDDTLYMIYVSGDEYYGFELWLVAADISEPMKVEEISRLSIPYAGGYSSLNMNKVYLALLYYDEETHEKVLTIYTIDVGDPKNMRIVTKMPFPQPIADIWDIQDMVVDNNLAYLSLRDDGVVILPLPREAKNISVHSSSRISATLPGPDVPGTYTIKLIDELDNDYTVGTITFRNVVNE